MNASEAQPRERKSPKGEARRNDILASAMRIFSREGYQNAAIAEVAKDVGLSLPGLLHYFPNKVSLLLAILERRDTEGSVILGKEPATWRAMLDSLRLLNRRNTQIAGVERAFSILNAESLIDDHPASDWFLRRSEVIKKQFATSIAAGIEVGEIRNTIHPERIATEIISVMDGLQIQWLRSPDTVDIIACFDDYLDRLQAGLANSPDLRCQNDS